MRLFIVVTWCIIFSLSGKSQGVLTHGQLNVSGVSLTDANGDTVVLRGLSYGWHNWWPRFYNHETPRYLAEHWGCTVLRAAMGVEPDKGYIKNPEWSMDKMTAVIDGAIEANIYVIVDWHSHNINLREAKIFFAEIAKRYGKYPHIIYEIFNEPDSETWPEVKAYSQEVIKVIRAIDPDNIILVGSPHWDQDLHSVADNPIKDENNIMYTLHFYAASHKQSLRDRGDYALSKGIPLFVSESAGMDASGNGPLDMVEWNKWINWMEKNKISWVAWSVADKAEACSMLLPSAGSEGQWADNQLKESGIKTRAFLHQYNK